MRPFSISTAVILAAASALSHAGLCDSVEETDRLIQCLGGENTKADALLNAEYSRLRGRLSPERRDQLREAQRAWIVFRDKDCEFEASAAAGGQAYEPLYVSCQTDKTMRRIKELKGQGS